MRWRTQQQDLKAQGQGGGTACSKEPRTQIPPRDREDAEPTPHDQIGEVIPQGGQGKRGQIRQGRRQHVARETTWGEKRPTAETIWRRREEELGDKSEDEEEEETT